MKMVQMPPLYIHFPKGVTKVGEISSIEKPIKVDDPMFGMVIGYYEKSVTFIQK